MKKYFPIQPSSLAVASFLFIPFVGIILGPYFFVGFLRFGFQWHLLLVVCLMVAACALPQTGFTPFLTRLFANKACWFFYICFSLWLLLMGLVHGYVPQSESLSSAFFLLLMFPVGLFVSLDNSRRWRVADVGMVLLIVIIVLENLFLTQYRAHQIPFNFVYLYQPTPTRLFLNTRDGNFVALILFLVATCNYSFNNSRLVASCRSKVFTNLLIVGFVSFQVFYNAWLTNGRSLLLCLFLLMSLLFCFAFKNTDFIMKRFVAVASGGFVMGFVSIKILELCMLSESPIASSLAEISSFVVRSDSGRFELWRLWIKSALSNSLWWGHGLGFIPTSTPGSLKTPHNLLVQLFADGGLISTSLSIFMLALFGRLIVRWMRFTNLYMVFLPLSASFLFASNVFNSESVWSLSILMLVVLENYSCLGSFAPSPVPVNVWDTVLKGIYFLALVYFCIVLSSAKHMVYLWH